MTNQKKRNILIVVTIGAICAVVLASSLTGRKAKTTLPAVSSSKVSASSVQSSADHGVFFSTQSVTSSSTVSEALDAHTATLADDAQKVLHLRYDLSDTSISIDELKQYLRDYMTEDALKQLFSNTSAVQPKVSASTTSSAVPSSSAAVTKKQSSSSTPVKKAESSLPSTSSKTAAASSKPDVTYRPIQGEVTPRYASFQPVTKTYSYVTVNRLYTKELSSQHANVLIYYTLSIAGDKLQTNTSNRVMSLNMEYSKKGHWVVNKIELDTQVDFSLAPFQK